MLSGSIDLKPDQFFRDFGLTGGRGHRQDGIGAVDTLPAASTVSIISGGFCAARLAAELTPGSA
jgi:hypothetical protein